MRQVLSPLDREEGEEQETRANLRPSPPCLRASSERSTRGEGGWTASRGLDVIRRPLD